MAAAVVCRAGAPGRLEMRDRLRADFDPKPIARPGTVREIAAAVCRAMGPRCR